MIDEIGDREARKPLYIIRSHAAYRGHSDFAESTEEIAPLTAEEKQQRLAELREKVKTKRANQAIVDKEEQKRNEVRLTLELMFVCSMSTNCPFSSKSARRLPRSHKI